MKIIIEAELPELREILKLVIRAMNGTEVSFESPPGSEKR
jgi:hypothetical protein